MSIIWPADVTRFNEADVRGEILDPLLRYLGYSASTDSIRREVGISIQYQRSYLGRKNPKTDPLLRGRADYILEADRDRRWVLEAKPSTTEITLDDIQQVYTYARHPEIAAVLYAISNGRELLILDPLNPPNLRPWAKISLNSTEECIKEIADYLSPEAILERFPRPRGGALTRPEVAPGFRSPLQILSGTCTAEILNGLQYVITDGTIERTADGLLLYLQIQAPVIEIQRQAEQLGLDRFEAYSDAQLISLNSEEPTRFVAEEHTVLPAGTTLYDARTNRYLQPSPRPIAVNVSTTIDGYLDGRELQATLSQIARLSDTVTGANFTFNVVGHARLKVV